jgi:redox-sensitive bicupin YhaK (pirin superfamily)
MGRLLPQRTLRTIGAWCFLDHYGPDEVSRGHGMQVPPHPHIGLQTVSWLFEGLVLHRDSLGSRQLIRPGELNLMTAGGGIAHSEESAAGRPPLLHGLQLWIALAEAERHTEPRFAHHADLPVVRDGAASVTVVVGGQPFAERLLMWWNFVARSAEEITRAREDWAAGRFDPVYGYPGAPLAAPPLPGVPLKPR